VRSFGFVARAVAGRTIHSTFSSPAALLPSIIPPLFFLIAFSGGFSAIAAVPHFDYEPGYTAFIFVFAFLQSATLAGVFTGFGIARDFDSGFARRLLLGAPARGGIIVGYLGASLARWSLAALAVTAAAVIGGMDVGGSGVELIGLAVIGILVNILAALWACGTAMLLRTEQAGPLIQLPVFIVLFLAPVYVPFALLGGWVHAVATVNPVTALLESGRGFLAGSPDKVILAFAVLVGGGCLLAVWARRGLASAEQAG
jgi:ABC-2 type transport system permease protein